MLLSAMQLSYGKCRQYRYLTFLKKKRSRAPTHKASSIYERVKKNFINVRMSSYYIEEENS